jgi:hypothetical protein
LVVVLAQRAKDLVTQLLTAPGVHDAGGSIDRGVQSQLRVKVTFGTALLYTVCDREIASEYARGGSTPLYNVTQRESDSVATARGTVLLYTVGEREITSLNVSAGAA